MARYINADLIKEKLQRTIINSQTAFINNVLIGLLDKAPTEDVQEVKHGEWIENGLYCSVCGYLYDTGEYTNSHNYCPDCGADMRKEKDKCVKPQTLDGGKSE